MSIVLSFGSWEYTDEFNLIKKMTKSDHHERITIEEVIYSEEMSRMINKM